MLRNYVFAIFALFSVLPSAAIGQSLTWESGEIRLKTKVELDVIFVDGQIQTGLTERINSLFVSGPPGSGTSCGLPQLQTVANQLCGLRFNSPGGDLLEALELGRWIRKNYVSTKIAADDECSSACAWPFLAGRMASATWDDDFRAAELSASGLLGFHGLGTNSKEVIKASSALSVAREATAQIYEYILDIGGIELNWVAEVLTVPSDEMYFVASINDYSALNLEIEHTTPPRFSDLDACALRLGKFRDRILGHSSKTVSMNVIVNDLRSAVLQRVSFKNSDAMNSFKTAIYKSDFFELANLLFDDFERITLNRTIKIVELQPGSGFYKSQCIHIGGGYTLLYDYIEGTWKELARSPTVQPRYPLADICSRYRGDLVCRNLFWAPGPHEYAFRYSPLDAADDMQTRTCYIGTTLAEVVVANKFASLLRAPRDYGKVVAQVPVGKRVTVPYPFRVTASANCSPKCSGGGDGRKGLYQDGIQLCLDNNELWIEVSHKGRTGFMSRRYLEPIQHRSAGETKYAFGWQEDMAELRSAFESSWSQNRAYIQESLRSLGLYSSSIDGKWGKGTEGAFRKIFESLDQHYPDKNWSRDLGFDDGKITPQELATFLNSVVGCDGDKLLRNTHLCKQQDSKKARAAQACGWFSLGFCSRSSSEAESKAREHDLMLIETTKAVHPNFNAGWFCAVEPQTSRSAALSGVETLKRKGLESAYAKNSC